jgi:nucleoside-diphosphate-sugar epimerase
LVTGAGGFIGGRLVRRILERRGRVHCLVRGTACADALRALGATVTVGDVTNRDSVVRALAESQAAAVFHLAGLVRARGRDEFMRVNCGGVEIVAAACAARSDPPTLVVVSSLAAAGPCSTEQIRVETDIPSPVSNYGRSKLAGEQAAAKYAGSVPITNVRPPVVFGPGDRAVLEVFRPISRWGIHVVPGRHGGDRRVSLVHVDDLVDGLLLAAASGERMQERGPPGRGVYFMAGEDRPTYADLGGAIAAALGGKPPTIIPVPGAALQLLGIGGDLISLLRSRSGWINSDKMREALAAGSWICSAAKARDQLGWCPAPSGALTHRLRETAEWYRGAGWL